jgi:AcrR family transcriptional regulator
MRRREEVDGRVSRARKQREYRRAAVLAVARQVFSQKGYHATSIDDLIAAADIARGTFYLYFESKRAIFDELLDELFQTLRAVVRRIEVGPGAPPPIEQMDATVERVLDTLVANREMARILLREAVGIDQDFDRKLGEFYDRIVDMIASALRNGRQMGLVRDLDERVVARAVLGGVKEVVSWAFVESPSGAGDEAGARRRLGHELIAFTLQGVFR